MIAQSGVLARLSSIPTSQYNYRLGHARDNPISSHVLRKTGTFDLPETTHCTTWDESEALAYPRENAELFSYGAHK
jgi:hypothetical protein